MLSNRPLLASVAFLLPLGGCSWVHSQTDISVIESTGDAYTLEVFDNSETFANAIAINAKGQLIGVREVVDKAGLVFSQESIFIDGKSMTTLPLLEGFTNIEIEALSDSGLVVGYASRPVGHPDGSLTAIAWDSSTGTLTNLGPAPGDTSSHAQDVSADGSRITGYSNGSSPPRLRPCVWTWNAKTKAWEAETLSVIVDNNPYIMSGRVIISPDGQRIAACITVEELSSINFDSSLFVWDWDGEDWKRKSVSDEQMHLKDINDSGEMAAVCTVQSGHMPCHIDLQGNLTQIALLEGDVSGEAHGIDPSGKVVGFSDDPAGPDGGPRAFVWEDGKTSPLLLPSGTQFSAAFGISARGQIAGMMDLEVPAGDKAAAGSEPGTVKTLAFRWSPTTKQKAR